MPELVRFLLSSFGNGAVMGLALAEALILFDVGALGRLLQAEGEVMTAVFFAQSAVLYGTLAMAVAVLQLDEAG